MKSDGFPFRSTLSFLVGTLMMGAACYLSLQVTSEVFIHSADPNWLTSYITGRGTEEVLLVLAAFVVLMTLGVPRQAVSFFCGVGFGAFEGGLIALLLTCVSASTAYLLVRGFLRKRIAKLIKLGAYESRFSQLREKFVRNSFRTVLMVRLFPIGSNVATNAIAGAFRVPFIPFITASALGFIPQTLLFSMLGSGSRYINAFEQPVHIAGLVVSVMLILSMMRFTRKDNA
ncbi:TVP38/TMEM64 family protein [Alteromonas stellipolaris]|uniref:TVP38/TMEM64 family protein n=1 Tax=Alteromonas stellipolaris TaxID=233316 RepID=UPI0027368142|nr:VTT domain-containing protein [Alteromonas stellipolaris]MDP2596280.1 VTT domain-containing protein [Alteromonas stellipolaris]